MNKAQSKEELLNTLWMLYDILEPEASPCSMECLKHAIEYIDEHSADSDWN